MDPLVSVIMPAYNALAFLEASLASLRAQTLDEWELLACDDGSSDGTYALLESAARADPRIHPLRSPRNLGAAGARNLAMGQARGRYLAFLDADDTWVPAKLARQVEFMRTTGAVLAYSAYRVIDAAGELVGLVTPPPALGYWAMLAGHRVGLLTAMVDRQAAGSLAFPDHPVEDLGLWLELVRRHGPGRGLVEPLATYRVVPGSLSRDKHRYYKQVWAVYRRQPLPLPVTALCFGAYAVRGALRHWSSGAAGAAG
jgi:glycosyltransferase involved in cell wall biosynthesis